MGNEDTRDLSVTYVSVYGERICYHCHERFVADAYSGRERAGAVIRYLCRPCTERDEVDFLRATIGF